MGKFGNSDIKKIIWALFAVWTAGIALALAVEFEHHYGGARELARAEVNTQYDWMVTLRSWLASHGGVYVPMTERTPSNPYLNTPEKDIQTPSGKKLTLMNPAYVTRQIYSEFYGKIGMKGHLTSLTPLNPNNTPDEWERAALVEFEKGTAEIFEFSNIGGIQHLRLMRPLFVEQPCIPCHEKQGYKLGDIRGGLSLSVPAEKFFVKAREGIRSSLMAYAAIWLAGAAALYLFSAQMLKSARERAIIQNKSAWLAAAVAHAADGVAITDAEGNIEYANPAFEEMTGYRLDEVLGKNPRVLKSGRHDRLFYEELWKTIKAGKVWRSHIVNRKKDGSLYEEEMTISPIADAGGAIVNFVAVKRDVTREAALQKSRAYFTDITAHELRTPLTKLHLVENMLKRIDTAGFVGGQVEDVRGALLESMTAFDRIVNATALISDMTRTGAEKPFGRNFIYYDVTAALENARVNIQEARRDIRLEADMADLPRYAAVPGNRAMISQALDEVLSNAIKFTPDGKTVRIRAYSGGGLVHVEVADEGEGIPEDKLRDVFIPYYSLENPLTHSTGRYKFHGGGMGLGLTVAKLVMEYHNGTLSIGNRADGRGTLVVLSFPLANEEPPPAAAHGF